MRYQIIKKPIERSALNESAVWLRAIAIFMVVGGHATQGLSNFSTSVPAHLVASLLVNGTDIFVLISGFLFCKVDIDKNVQPHVFYRRKLLTLIIPYFSVTLIVFTLRLIKHGSDFSTFYERDYLEYFMRALVTGYETAYPLWYMPMIISLFILFPLLRSAVTSPFFPLLSVAALVLFFCTNKLVFLREIEPLFLNGPLAALHFLGAFLAGAALAKYKKIATKLVAPLAIIFLISTALDLHSSIYLPDPAPQLFYYNIIDTASSFFVLPQSNNVSKISFGLLILSLSLPRAPAWVSAIAHHSFAIFFTHSFLTSALQINLAVWCNSILDAALYAISCFVMSFFLAALLTKALGRCSKYILGANSR